MQIFLCTIQEIASKDPCPADYQHHYTLFSLAPPTTTLATTNSVAPAIITTPLKTCSLVYDPCSTSETNAPPIGVPVKAANEMIEKKVPLRTPTSRRSEIWAISAGARETKAPEPKPYSALKTIAGALLRDGSHRASTRMPDR